MLGYQYTNTVELQPTEDELVAAVNCLLRVPVTWGVGGGGRAMFYSGLLFIVSPNESYDVRSDQPPTARWDPTLHSGYLMFIESSVSSSSS
jgi:hypothetical protein